MYTELRKPDTVIHNGMQHEAHNGDYKVFLPKQVNQNCRHLSSMRNRGLEEQVNYHPKKQKTNPKNELNVYKKSPVKGKQMTMPDQRFKKRTKLKCGSCLGLIQPNEQLK